MAFTRAARKALSKSRQGKTSQARYHAYVDAGEDAYRRGEPLSCTTHDATDDDKAAWLEGWYLAREDARIRPAPSNR